jgi:O-antigen/teichoic acid export membrane protein
MTNTFSAAFRKMVRSILHLGSGEMAGRVCNIAIVIGLGHYYGVVILGVYALAQSVTQYLQPLIDFGLRHIGARLVALYPHAAGEIVTRVQRRRRWMAVAALPLILIYSVSAELPFQMKIFLSAFCAVGVLYAASLDWASWGEGRLHLVGLAKSIVPASILIFLLIGRPSPEHVLRYAVAGNGFGFLLQGTFFWWWWKKHYRKKSGKRPRHPQTQSQTLRAVDESLAWRRTGVMGMAWICYLAFNNVDMLMLGLMSNAEQVGLYGAAYRVLNQALATYYLLTQVLYPQFARHTVEERTRMLGARVLVPIFASGMVIAIGIAAARHLVLSIVFGHQFLAAAPLLLLLAWCVPLDFMTSYLSNAFLAWGMESKVLLSTGIGALANIGLNLVFIPRLGARGAAINTLISYVLLLTALSLAVRRAKEIGGRNDLEAGSGVGLGIQPLAEVQTDTVGCP